jgi:hypothetical protein
LLQADDGQEQQALCSPNFHFTSLHFTSLKSFGGELVTRSKYRQVVRCAPLTLLHFSRPAAGSEHVVFWDDEGIELSSVAPTALEQASHRVVFDPRILCVRRRNVIGGDFL